MSAPITSHDIFESHRKQLGFEWLAGEKGGSRNLQQEDTTASDLTLIGYLNLVRPNRIQVIGKAELEYLTNLGKNSYKDVTALLFAVNPAVILIAENEPVPPDLCEQANKTDTPLISSSESGSKVIDHLRYYLTFQLTDKVILHGVFMEVLGIGVLLTGPSGVGKSELALELLSRGHRLIADDAPEFSRISPDTISGACPKLLSDFMEVRGLGILNIRAMFGDNAVLKQKRLRLIVNLELLSETTQPPTERLDSTHRHHTILDVEIPEVVLPVAPGRDLAVIIEAAVRNHVLYLNGYNAAQDFIERQQALINKNNSQS